ncbi:MAG: DNRLRE domain-containing protein [candidate division WOR-3 bacterium]|nr:DNRLRE domain-containing protein [candidate division WOR-3 bacterium]
MKTVMLVLCITICLVPFAWAEEALITAVQDATVWSNDPDGNYGTLPLLEILGGSGAEDTARALVQFDLTELPYTEDMVDTALLRLWLPPDTDYVGGHAGVYPATEAWDEGTVAWNNMPAENRYSTVLDLLPPHPQMWFEVDITYIVYSWLYEDAENHGVYVEVPEETPYGDAWFAGKEYGDTALRPKLRVRYKTGICEAKNKPGLKIQVSPVSTGAAEIKFSLPTSTSVSLMIYDASGALVQTLMDESVGSGDHYVIWDGAPGVYFVRLETPNFTSVRKLVLVR